MPHPAFYRVSFLGSKRRGRGVNPSSLSSVEIRISGTIPLLRPRASMVWTGKNVTYELTYGRRPFWTVKTREDEESNAKLLFCPLFPAIRKSVSLFECSQMAPASLLIRILFRWIGIWDVAGNLTGKNWNTGGGRGNTVAVPRYRLCHGTALKHDFC